MLTLYRAGRQAEALAAYRRARELLREELGIEPGAELQRLLQAILNGDPALDAVAPTSAPPPVVVPRQLPSDVAGFTGRAEALKALDELLGRRSGPVVISAIAGTAGVGKTALAVHWAHRAAARFPDGQLYANLRGFDPSGTPMEPAAVVRGFLDALQVPPERVPASLEAQVSLYRSLLAERRVLVVLDNARDADQVRPLLPGASGCLVLVTSRSQLSGLMATDGAVLLPIDVLPESEARMLLAARLGDERLAAEPEAVVDLVAACAGLPLALAIVAARAAARPGFPLSVVAEEVRGAGAGLEPWTGPDAPTDLRAVFSWSYDALEPAAARLFRLLGLHPGPDLALPAAASLAGATERQAHRSLAALSDANLVIEHTPGRWTLHDLLRTYAAELAETTEPGAARHAARYRLLDHYLHGTYAAATRLDPNRRMAYEPEALAPGATAIDIHSPEQAMEWLTTERAVLLRAVEQALTEGLEPHVWQLASCLVGFLDRQGHTHDHLSTQRAALLAAQQRGNRLAVAHAQNGIGSAYRSQGDLELAVEYYQRAFRLYCDVGDDYWQAIVQVNFAYVAQMQGDYSRAVHSSERAYELFRQAENLAGQAHALNAIAWCSSLLGRHWQAIEYGRRALAIHKELGSSSDEAFAWDSLGYAHYQRGDHEQAFRMLPERVGAIRSLG